MRVWLLLAAAALAPQEQVVEDWVDVIEVNHLYDEQGALVLDQVIFWEWKPDQRAFRVVGWRLLNTSTQHPQWDPRQGGFTSVWRDGNVLRRVYARSKRTTWTQYDPEIYDRQFLPPHERRGLIGERTPPADWLQPSDERQMTDVQ